MQSITANVFKIIKATQVTVLQNVDKLDTI